MIIGFKTRNAKGQPTDFVRKIINDEKIHTLREDRDKRWKAGMTIQFATGVRTPAYKEFKQGECKSVQKVDFKFFGQGHSVVHVAVSVDDRMLTGAETIEFARNDGFDSLDSFIDWFRPIATNEELSLRLIHWTDKLY